jgi:hypothetical protein
MSLADIQPEGLRLSFRERRRVVEQPYPALVNPILRSVDRPVDATEGIRLKLMFTIIYRRSLKTGLLANTFK